MSFLKKYSHLLSLVIITLISRLVFATHYLYSWDAAQLALALKSFDLASHQPHPPGYILYVALGKMLNFFIPDANTVYVYLSIIVSVLTVILFYFFLNLLVVDKKFSFLITLILIINPYFWFFGEVASTYIFDAFFSLLFACLTWLIYKRNDPKFFLIFSTVLGLAGGFRLSLIYLFLPLWFYAGYQLIKKKRLNWCKFFLAVFFLIFVFSLWFTPLIYLSHGFNNWWRVNNWLLNEAANATSIMRGAPTQIVLETSKSLLKVILIIINFIFLSLLGLLSLSKNKIKPPLWLFFWWLAPSLFFYIFIHFGNKGYLMTVASALIILVSWPLFYLWQTKKKIFYLVLLIILIGELNLFLINKDNALTKKINYDFDQKNLARLNKKIDSYLNSIKQFPSQETIVVTLKNFHCPSDTNPDQKCRGEYFRQLEYYLSDYDVYELFGDSPAYFHVKNYSPLKLIRTNGIAINQKIKQIIIICDELNPELKQDVTIVNANESNIPIFIIDISLQPTKNWGQYIFTKK